MHGSVVVVLFWASWCTPCQAEQPSVNALAAQEAALGVHFLGVSVDVDRSAAESYVRRYAVPYDSLIDAGQTIVVDFEVAGPPTTFVIDGRGRVAAELLGELNADDLRAHIEAARGGV
jgi:thiol-disulfide isomerase/thioredoxin